MRSRGVYRASKPKQSRKKLDKYAEYLSVGVTRRTFNGSIYVLADIRATKTGAVHEAARWRDRGRRARCTSTEGAKFKAYRGKPAYAVWVN